MSPVRTVVIGTGKAARAHIEALRRLGFVEIAGICGTNRNHTERQARQLHMERVYHDYREVLSDPGVDAVHICTTNDRHYEVSKAALLAGKAVVSEKPLAVTSAQARELAAIARDSGLSTAVMFNYRMYAMVQEARRLVAGNALGRLNLVRGGYLQDWLLEESDYDWRLQTEQGGPGGVLADIASHWCDLVEYISGDRITAVLADTAVIHQRRCDERGCWQEVAAPEYASVLLRFASGARGVFTVSQVSPGHKNDLFLALDGSLASLAWRQEEPEKIHLGQREPGCQCIVKDAARPGAVKELCHYPPGHIEGWPDGVKNLLLGFYSHLLQQKENRTPAAQTTPPAAPLWPTFADGYRSVRLVEAMLQSAASGNVWVKIEEA